MHAAQHGVGVRNACGRAHACASTACVHAACTQALGAYAGGQRAWGWFKQQSAGTLRWVVWGSACVRAQACVRTCHQRRGPHAAAGCVVALAPGQAASHTQRIQGRVCMLEGAHLVACRRCWRPQVLGGQIGCSWVSVLTLMCDCSVCGEGESHRGA